MPNINNKIEDGEKKKAQTTNKTKQKSCSTGFYLSEKPGPSFFLLLSTIVPQLPNTSLFGEALSLRYSDNKNSPVNIPSNAVPMAGKVLNIPSGS